jgi:hypothetical protein
VLAAWTSVQSRVFADEDDEDCAFAVSACGDNSCMYASSLSYPAVVSVLVFGSSLSLSSSSTVCGAFVGGGDGVACLLSVCARGGMML